MGLGHGRGRVGATDRACLLHRSNDCAGCMKHTEVGAVGVNSLKTRDNKTRAWEKLLGTYFFWFNNNGIR